ncbi:peptidoglycan-binding protein [Streptomyces sp900116325]|uniref:peptidoglycan-binding domain-containing protein n=1 Tax=Streptomyces sp. 900116325 TaxID=3154295 RepID=UPI0033E3A118
MKRSPRTLRTAASTCAIAALTVFGAAQAPTIATASSDPATTMARHATTLQGNPNWPTTRSGNHGIAVTALQHLLTARGHAVSPDGAYGPRTAVAVRAFQTLHHLQADAVAGARTWKALVTTVRAGSHGSAVTAAQKLLTARGHAVSPDGAFGPRTAAAVKAFQTRSHLEADGVIGPRTWSALLTTSRSTQPTTPSTRPGTGTYTLKLTRNGNQPLNSRLALLRGGKVIDSYRAGSGMGSTDECLPDKGWLPSGTYKVKGHETNRGGWNYAEHDPAGRDLQPLIDLIDTHGTGAILAAVDRLDGESAADVTVSTAHKAKGREWPRVQICRDFTPPRVSDQRDGNGHPMPGPIDDTEARLAYVAVTRARKQLDLGGLPWIEHHRDGCPA